MKKRTGILFGAAFAVVVPGLSALSWFSFTGARNRLSEAVRSFSQEIAAGASAGAEAAAGSGSAGAESLSRILSSTDELLRIAQITNTVLLAAAGVVSIVALYAFVMRSRKDEDRVSSILDSASELDGEACDRDDLVCIAGTTPDRKLLIERISDFVERYRGLVRTMRAEVSKNVESSTNLSVSLDNTSSTFEVVDGFIESIRNEVMVLEEQVKLVKTGLERVTSGLNNLDYGISNQKTVVEGSMTSVNGMIASVNRMASDAKRDEIIVEKLVNVSDEAQTLFSSTYRKITLISDSISRINGMATVIEAIAEQTNMLALNAAIEAAHAGDAGKGFAVVAEEMTKLAEASTESSREIAESIEEIVENITSMASSSGRLDQSFEEMSTSINDVYRTISNFSRELVESDKDSKLVLETMNTLESVTGNVRRDSANMSEGAGAIAFSMSELDMIASRVFDGITAMSLMLSGLKDVMGDFKQLAVSMRESGILMDDRLSRLKQ